MVPSESRFEPYLRRKKSTVTQGLNTCKKFWKIFSDDNFDVVRKWGQMTSNNLKMTFIVVKWGWNDFLFEDPDSTHQDRRLDTHHYFWGWFFISVICQLTDLTAENKGENQIIHVACGVSIVNIPPYWHQMLPSESRFKPYLSKKKKYSDPMSQHL